MSKYHEGLKDILQDVVNFIIISLGKESLTLETIIQKDGIIKKITKLLIEYPSMNIKIPPKSDKKETAPPFLNLLNHPQEQEDDQGDPYTPSYLDMGSPKSLIPFEEEYEVPEVQNDPFTENISPKIESIGTTSIYSEEKIPEVEDTSSSGDGVLPCDFQSVLKSGYLEKKRKGTTLLEQGLLLKFHPFQKRWCVIRNHIFSYYDRETDRKPKGKFSLAGYEANPLPTMTKDSNKRYMSFELVCPGKRAFQFIASSVQDMKEWIAAIEEARKRVPRGVKMTVSQLPQIIKTKENVEEVEDDDGEGNIYEHLEDENEEEESQKNADGESLPTPDIYDEGESLFPIQTTVEKSAEVVECVNDDLDMDNWYLSQWDCIASDANELSFYYGDKIHVISREYDCYSWWVGELNGKIGFVPKNYLVKAYELVEE